jgi:hypothetical protein
LAIGGAYPDGRTDIHLAFRLYDDDERGHSDDPLGVFTAILDRYGSPVTVGEMEGMFIPRATVHLREGQGQIVSVHNPNNESFVVCASVKVAADRRTADVAWAFSVLTERYRADVRRRQR